MTDAPARAIHALHDAAVALRCVALGEQLARALSSSRRNRRWSGLEDDLLRAAYGHLTNRELVAVFRRTEAAIKRRAFDLRVMRTKTRATTRRQRRDLLRHPNWNGWQKGHVPHTWVPIGTEVTDSLGYRKRKVREGAKPAIHNFRFVHVLLWEKHHGPAPEGHAVVFRNGDKTDIRIENLECISRRELMRRNTRWNRYPEEVNELITTRARLTRRISNRSKEL